MVDKLNKKSLRELVFPFVSAVIGIAVGASVQLYIHNREFANMDWSLSSSDNERAFVIDTDKHSFYICYNKGDEDYLYFDNSNKFGPFHLYKDPVETYPRIKRGECEIVSAVQDSPNIGFYLDSKNNAKWATGTWRLVQ